ncbi:baseplate assembly protein [Gluconobacter cerinus]|uniref:baseplate assembly protein n=1 Tax=Gluconobacter cerinus TaxID=38307 RepID=UPI001FD5C34C|nr:baseplate assembly protein [Gluconobacter cerinus]
MSDTRMLAAALANRSAHAVLGIVSAVDPSNHAIKVRIQPDNVETGWIPDVGGVQAGNLRVSCPSEPGTHVALLPLEGDGEHLIAIGAVFDTVVTAPVSPSNGQTIRPGTMLIRAGCGAPPTEKNGKVGDVNPQAGWCQIGSDGVILGAGNARLHIAESGISLTIGDVTAVFSANGLKVSGGDIQTDQHSLTQHVHLMGSQTTGGPIG